MISKGKKRNEYNILKKQNKVTTTFSEACIFSWLVGWL
jgi:hypothetical protein